MATLRPGDELPDDALVVRGDVMRPDDVRNAAETAQVRIGVLGVSVYAARVDRPAQLGPKLSPQARGQLARYPKLRSCRAGELRGAGFALLPTGATPHYTVVLPSTAPEVLAALAAAFGPPEDNDLHVPR